MKHDIVSNFAAVMNQAVISKRTNFIVTCTRMTTTLASLLYREGLIYSYEINYINNNIQIILNQIDGRFVFSRVRRISKPSKRVHWPLSKLRNSIVKEGRFYIISTSFGLMTSSEALKRSVSGEILMEIFFQ